MKSSHIFKVSKYKFDNREYEYDLSSWDNITCIEVDCTNVARGIDESNGNSKFCSASCSRKTLRRKTGKSRVYQIQCKQCDKYFLTRYCKTVWCSERCKFDYENIRANKIYKDKLYDKGHVGHLIHCNAPWCSNFLVPKYQSTTMCSTSCARKVTVYKKKNIDWKSYYKVCSYRFCDNRYLVNYTRGGPANKKFCDKSCSLMEHHYLYRLPGRWQGKKNRPLYLYIMFNKKLNCYKFGITVHKKKRFLSHERNGFELTEYRYFPKNAAMVEATFKQWLKYMDIKPPINKKLLKDGWSETICGDEFQNFNLNFMTNIYKQYGKKEVSNA